MNSKRISSALARTVLLAVLVLASRLALAVEQAPTSLSAAAIEKLVERIAIYPDVVLQPLLAAATFPDQIIDAGMFLDRGGDPNEIQDQPWDDSVKAVANYPSVIDMMIDDMDWTVALGDAVLNQNRDVLDAVQRLRARAKAVGNLSTSDKQRVIQDEVEGQTIIRVEPAAPNVVYVPAQTISTVYVERQRTNFLAPLATFGVGMALGYALNDDDDDFYYGHAYRWWGGPRFWHHDDHFDNWMSYRRERWRDRNDYFRDRREFRQDYLRDRQDFRQDRIARWDNNRADYLRQRQDRYRNMSPQQREQARSRARAEYQRRGGTASTVNARQNLQNYKSASPERRQELRSQAQSRARGGSFDRERMQNIDRSKFENRMKNVDRARAKERAQSINRSSAKRNALSGYGDRTSVRAAKSRGTASRAHSGGSARRGGRTGGRSGGRRR